MAYTNNNGQIRVGVRSGISNSPIVQPAFSASLIQSLYGVWNGDTTTNELGTSLYGVWNGDTTTTVTTLNGSVSSAWNGDNFYSTSGITASNVNNVTLSTGKIGNAFTFNGSNYVSIPSSFMNFTGDFTANFWIKINSTAVLNQGIMGNMRWGLGPGGFQIIFNNGWLQALAGNQNNGSAGFLTQAPNGYITNFTTWTMVTFIYRKGVSNSFYINAGTPNTIAHQHTLLSSIFNGQLGSEPMDNYRLNGNLDAVTFWDRAITENEIHALYNSTNGREYPYPSTISVDIPSPNDSFGTNHGTLMNGCSFTTGKIGNAFSFDGVNDYMELPANSMNLTGDLTISFWAYMRTRDYNNIICNMDNNGVSRGFYIDSDGSYALRFVGYNSTYTLVKTDNSALFDLNVWNHFTFTLKNGVGQWYKNGVASGSSGTIVYSLISGNKPIIGGYRTGNNGSVTSNKNMALDAFTIWNKAISQDEITQLYNLGSGVQYPFVGTLPSTMNQLGVDNATLVNGCYLSDGKIGKAFTFDGVNDYVQFPNNSLNSLTGDFSISAWVNIGSYKNQQIITNFNNTSNYYGFQFYVATNVFRLDMFNGTSTSYSTISSVSTLSTGVWYHVVFTRKSSTSTKIYINGVLNATDNSTLNPIYHPTTNYCNIGAHCWNGVIDNTWLMSNGSKIDALNVWQKELTQSEVTELYNSGNGKQITATPIVQSGLLFNLDASRTSSYVSGTTWYDNSGNGNHGTFYPAVIVPNTSGTTGVAYWSTGVKHFSFNAVDGAYGTGTYMKLPVSNMIDSNGYTFGGWVKSTTSDTSTRILKGADGIYGGWALALSISSTDVWVTLCNAYSQSPSLTATSVVTQNTWYYVICRYNHRSELKLYVNGVAVATLPQATPITNSNEISLRTSPGWVIGAFSTTVTYKSTVSTFHSYNRVLTDSEILQNFNATKSTFGY